MLNTLTAGCVLPDQKLTLQLVLRVILVHNLDHSMSLVRAIWCKPSILIFLYHHESLPDNNLGKVLALPKMPFDSSYSNFPIQKFTKAQLTMRAWFSITVNKAQEKSFSGEVGYLSGTFFLHGQLYIGLTRVKHTRTLKLCLLSHSGNHPKSLMYPEALR